MPTSFGALCNDFYVNQQLALKMPLPSDRETVLHLFDRIRKQLPEMDRFQRFKGELSLESSRDNGEYRWLGLRRKSVRTSHVNPDAMAQAYAYHQFILEQVPFHLTVSPLDVDYLELIFGFDLECRTNHDEVVAEALLAGSTLGDALGRGDQTVLDTQPLVAIALNDSGSLQASFEIRTRPKDRFGGPDQRYQDDPISIMLAIRRYGPVQDVRGLPTLMRSLTEHAETLATERVIPYLLSPIARVITSSNA